MTGDYVGDVYSLELNHFYLMVLLAWCLAVVPADHSWSLDNLRAARSPQPVPYWSVVLLRSQLVIVFFFAGLAKLNGEWLHSRPAHHLLTSANRSPLIHYLAGLPYADGVMVYGGLLLDLSLPWLWLWPRSRLLAFLLTAGFMTLNGLAFHIGVFPCTHLKAQGYLVDGAGALT